LASTKRGALKCPVAIAQRRPDAVKAESNDVVEAVVIQIDHKPGMLVHFPASGFEAELGIHHVGILESAIAIAQGCPHSALSETDDVRKPAVSEPGEKPRMFFNPPSLGDCNVHDAPAAQCPGEN
jgi:hypothetical protein